MLSLDALLVLFGVVVLLLSFGAGIIRSRAYLPSEVMLATIVGIAVGPAGLDLFSVTDLAEPMVLVEELSRLTVAVAVMAIALKLPERYVRDRARSLALLVGPGMIVMWLVSAGITYALFPVSLAMALLVGAILTPTDPVIATSIVQGRTAEENIPQRLRYLIMGEAGANDGVAYAFVFLALFVLGATDDPSLGSWLATTVAWELLGAVVLGLVLGALSGRLEHVLSELGRLEESSLFTITIALTVVVLGVAAMLGTDSVLAVFVAGLAYNWQARPRDEAREGDVEETFNRLFTLPVFVIFGAAIPWGAWLDLGWRAIALVVGILLLRRLPMLFALRPGLEPVDRREATLFVGWFGPIGVAALLYATLAVHETGNDLPWVLGSLVVAGSILAFGVTATAATHWYGGLDDDADWW